jgi:preprotein translocase subunit YajC
MAMTINLMTSEINIKALYFLLVFLILFFIWAFSVWQFQKRRYKNTISELKKKLKG